MKKLLLSAFHKIEPSFTEGGKWAKYYPFYEAFESFLFSTREVTKKGPHVRDAMDTKRYMNIVILSMLPCLAFGVFNAGYQSHMATGLTTELLPVLITGLKHVLPLVIVSYAIGLGWEFLCAIIRGHEINEGYLVTGMLIPLTLPPTMPLWQVALGVTFGVIVGKEVFGGTGRNFLNPALTTRAFLFFAFPAKMSGDAVWTALPQKGAQWIDGFSGATALSVAASATDSVTTALVEKGFTLSKLFLGLVPGSVGETSALMALLGATLLLATGIASYRTIFGCVIGLVATSTLFNVLAGPSSVAFLSLPPVWHLVMGGFAFGAVYMATDPVSSPALNASKWVYGILIGALTVIIRTINPAYPEGVMLAILLMNVFAPLIDHVMVQRQLKRRIPNVI